MDEQSLAVLKIVSLPHHSTERFAARKAVDDKYSDEDIKTTYYQLVAEGYIDNGVPAGMGFLTDKGRASLEKYWRPT